MDRIDAMRVFVTALDEGSLRAAGRKLGKSPAAISRAVALLEKHAGAQLLHRTTRTMKMTEAGERYAQACHRILRELDEADTLAVGVGSAPRGTLTLTAPIAAGEDILCGILHAFMKQYPAVSVRLVLSDRQVSLIDEGIDMALRIGHLPDSTDVAIRVGEVRRVVAASPSYLLAHPEISSPSDIAGHRIIAMTHFGSDSWSFPSAKGASIPRSVIFAPYLVVNSVRAAVASASDGVGIARLFSYHIAEQIRDGTLKVILADDEQPPLPVHLISPKLRLSLPRARAFADFAVPRLRAAFARMKGDASVNGRPVLNRTGVVSE